MSLRTRRIIMFCFIVTFFVLAPTLIFYASGYRYDTKRNKILRTGTLMVEAKGIKKANLYINDRLYKDPFSDKIYVYNLLPGEYQIRLEKNGYHAWEKKINVFSGLTSFAKDIILFKDKVPLQIIAGQVIDFNLSPDGQKAACLTENDSFKEVYLYNLETKDKTLLYRTSPDSKISLSWAPSSKKVLAKVGNNYLILDAENFQNNLILQNFLRFVPADLKWDLRSDNLLYGQDKNSIYKIDLFDKKSQKIFTLPATIPNQEVSLNPEFYIQANDIFYIQRETAKNVLLKYNLNFATNKKILELAKSTDYKFITSNNNFLGLIDLNLQKLHLIKEMSTDLEININNDNINEFNAKDASWDKAEKSLLIYDDFEIYTYNPDQQQETFINRYGEQIKMALWYPDQSHLVVLIANTLKIIDTNNIENSTLATTDLVKFDQITNFDLDKKGDNLYFNGQIGKQAGFYKQELK